MPGQDQAPKFAQYFNAFADSADGQRVLLTYCQPALARLVQVMAQTGIGTDACLRSGCMPMTVHYYTPVPDVYELKDRGALDAESALPGVDFRPQAQLDLLARLGGTFGQECDWPQEPGPDPFGFHLNNGNFSYGCAASLHCMIRDRLPREIVEIGSGNSSKVISAALAANAAQGRPARYAVVDPNMRPEYRDLALPHLAEAHHLRVEELPVAFFDRLGEDDILFVDSSHVSKAGSDVNFLILEVLPRLKPGVVVHFHDIPLPFEYPTAYFLNAEHRRFWNESYLLQAFLACNDSFEVLLAMTWLMRKHADAFRRAFARFDASRNWAESGSFWIRRAR